MRFTCERSMNPGPRSLPRQRYILAPSVEDRASGMPLEHKLAIPGGELGERGAGKTLDRTSTSFLSRATPTTCDAVGWEGRRTCAARPQGLANRSRTTTFLVGRFASDEPGSP